MKKRQRSNTSGITLLEVTIAVALFAIVIAFAAQALVSLMSSMNMQDERIEALNSCRSILGALREKRTEYYDHGDETMDWEGLFAWIADNNDDNWAEIEGVAADEGYAFALQTFDMDGAAAQPGDNPLQVIVEATWTDARGHPMRAALNTVIAEL